MPASLPLFRSLTQMQRNIKTGIHKLLHYATAQIGLVPFQRHPFAIFFFSANRCVNADWDEVVGMRRTVSCSWESDPFLFFPFVFLVPRSGYLEYLHNRPRTRLGERKGTF